MKKKIISFLAFAIIATSSGVIFRLGENPQKPQQLAATSSIVAVSTPTHYESLSNPSVLASQTTVPAASIENDLTSLFTSNLAEQLVEQNPKGPETIDGKQWLTVPDPNKVVQDYFNEAAKNFDPASLKPTIPDSSITISNDESSEAKISYFTSLADILKKNIGADALRPLSNDSSVDSGTIKTVVAYLERATLDLYKLPVPRSMLDLHKDIISILSAQKNIFEKTLNENDPVTGILAIQSNQIYLQEIQRVEQKIFLGVSQLVGVLPQETHPVAAFFGINVAHAIPTTETVGTQLISIVSDAFSNFTDLVKHILDIKLKLLTEILKQRILAKMQGDIINWINGGGEPKFISDWDGFLKDAFDQGLGEYLNIVSGGILCGPLSAQLRITLVSPSGPYGLPSSCSLSQIGSNIQNFFNDFKSGGWISYAEIWQPEENYYGQQLIALIGRDEAAAAANKKAETAKAESIANQGFLSVKVCKDEPAQGPTQPGHAAPTARVCNVVTPGKAIGDTLSNAINVDFLHVVTSQDLSAFIAGIADALINRLLKEGISALQGGVSGLLGGGGGSSGGGGSGGGGTAGGGGGGSGGGGSDGLTNIGCDALEDPVAIDACHQLEILNGQLLEDPTVCLSINELSKENKAQQITDNLSACASGTPVVIITSPKKGAKLFGTAAVSANAVDLDDGIDRVEFYLDGSVLLGFDSGDPYSISFDTTIYLNGSHTLTARAYNSGLPQIVINSDSVQININN